MPLGLWSEAGAPGLLPGAAPTPDARRLLQDAMMQPLPEVAGFPATPAWKSSSGESGAASWALSWSHLLIDGKGAELFLSELGRLCDGVDLPDDVPNPPRPVLGLLAKFRKTRPRHETTSAACRKPARPRWAAPGLGRARGFTRCSL